MIKKRLLSYELSTSLRLTHWLRAVSIVVLIMSGFYLAYVFVTPGHSNEPILFLNAKVRMWHIIAGFLLICVTIFKIYLIFTDKYSIRERVSFLDFINPKIWFYQIRYYLFLGKHPELKGIYNPLQFATYVFLYSMVILIALTGLILYMHVYHHGLGGYLYDILRPVEAWMGGLAMVRQIHHLAMWPIIIFTVVHVYMAVFNSVMGRDGSIDTIISGYRFYKPEKKH
ncbi:MAG: Ni/Fe-hydrogenase, b-type cytochrome subunit [Sulfurospirillum sp.]|nr:Ni/Fe-hydrogenase, b-type cytochrome subunit [Sulfurospirillum sp.]